MWRIMLQRVAVIMAVIALPYTVGAQDLTDEAQAELEAGLAAAQASDWDAAIEAFGKARELAPTAPEPLFNLGLAHDKAGKAPLIAAVWYHVYLAAADPDAAPIPQVEARIKALEAKSDAMLADLVQALDAELPGIEQQLTDYWHQAEYEEEGRRQLDEIRAGLAIGHAALGNVERAFAVLNRSTNPGSTYYGITSPAETISRLALAKVEAGDLEGAMAIMGAILPDSAWEGSAKHLGSRSHVQYYVVEGLIKAGRLDEAQAIAARIESDWYRYDSFRKIADARIEAGDLAAAKAALDQARTAAESYFENKNPSPRTKTGILSGFVERQAKLGDLKAARATLRNVVAIAKKAIGGKPQEYGYDTVPPDVVRAQVDVGAFKEARATVVRWVVPEERDDGYEDILDAALAASNFPEMEKTLALYGDEGRRPYYVYQLALTRIEAGDVTDGLAMSGQLETPGERADLYGAAAMARAEAGDAEGARALLAQAQDSAEQSASPEQLSAIWTNTGAVLARLGDHAGYSDAFGRAIQAAQAIPLDQHPAWYLIGIVREQAKAGDRESALHTLSLAENSLRDEAGGGPSWYWKTLGEAFAEAGNQASAMRARKAREKAKRSEGRSYQLEYNWKYLAPVGPNVEEALKDPAALLARLRDNPEHDYPGYRAQELARMISVIGRFRIRMLTKELEWIASWREE